MLVRLPRFIRRSPIHALADGEFIQALSQRYQAIPAELSEPEILALFLPSLRADYTIFETYEFTAREPLTCPITAFGGREDRAISEEELRAWGEQTSGKFRCELVAGGHFFLHQNRDEFLPRLTEKLQTIVETL
ncbi:MAG: thioesterase [Chloroflexaceae bacterium]|nr:thioesterase [Chloroflexaceae bacterium]